MFRLFAWMLLPLLLLTTPVYAENEETAETELPPVTVTAQGLNASTDDPPAFTEVIEMHRFAGRMTTTEQVLRQAAGVNVRSFGGLGSTATISVRGASSQQVVVLVDGVRLNPAAGGGADLGAISPEQIERIEIVRGGGSALYGEGAIGGVVNIITRKPDGQPRNAAALTYGDFNTWRFAGSRSGGGGRWRYLAAGSYLHSDGTFRFRNDNGTTLDDGDDFDDVRVNNQLDARSLLIRVGYAPSDTADITAHTDLYSADSGVPGLITFPSPHVHRKLLRDVSSLSASLTGLGAPGLSATVRLGNRYEWSRYRDGRGEQTGVPVVSERAEIEPEVEPRLQYIWGTHQIWTLTGLARYTRLDDADFDDPTRDSWAVALRDQVFLWGGAVTLTAAVRYDDADDAGSQWSPKAGLALSPWNWLTLKGNFGRSFRAPSFGELYFNQGYVEGNPDLKPERAWHGDAGLCLRTSWLAVEGAYFRSEVDDLIEYTLISGFRYKPFNIGRALLEGGELSARLSPWRRLDLAGAYTLTYATDDTDRANREDNQIPGRPRYAGFGRVETHAGIFHPFAEYHYVGGNYITAANTKLLDARHILNAGLLLRPDASTRLSLEMKNALDDRAVDVRGFPLPGRAMYLTMERSF